jgi:type III pantothenate kinase
VTANTCIVAADVGNTALKLCLRADPQGDGQLIDHTVEIVGEHWHTQAIAWVQDQLPCQSLHWRIASVHRRAASRLVQAITRGQPDATLDRTTRHDIPLKTLVDHPDRLGIDRLIGAFAAHNRFGGPVVVVDAGSAVTIDYVSVEAEFVGGAILPGLSLQTRALATGTDALPHIDWNSEPSLPAPGRNTTDAIRLGVLLGLAGAVERLVSSYHQISEPQQAERSSQSCQVVLTGGDAANISPQLRFPHQIVPNLVCRGLLDLPRSGENRAKSQLEVN